MSKRIGVVIVNWNSGSSANACVRSLDSIPGAADLLEAVVVVDNASEDGSADLAACQTIDLKILRNGTNLGFAAACNQGARLLESDYLLFLNPDTRVSRESLIGTVAALESPLGNRIGIVGPRLLDDAGSVARSCCRFPNPLSLCLELTGLDRLLRRHPWGCRMREFDHLTSREVDHVIGAFFLVRREVFVQLNGFDETFFLYFEDLDFSLRAQRAGWRSWYCAEAVAQHSGGICSRRIPGRRLFYSWSSRILFVRKHCSRLTLAIVALGTLIVEPVARVFFALCGLSLSQVRWVLSAYSLFLKSLVPGAACAARAHWMG
jgi:N-acetylglucosaminyl-diphospho-decaprenol L-rhamnosyltransferase